MVAAWDDEEVAGEEADMTDGERDGQVGGYRNTSSTHASPIDVLRMCFFRW